MKRNRTNGCRGICLLLCLVIFVVSVPLSAAAEGAASETVRVGWYEDSYNITGAHGERSGYGYEFQQSVAAYTGWNYTYVKAGWSDLLKMMQNGEIDIMSGVSYTEERAQSMLFSDLPMGEEKYYLYADLVHTDISASDLSTLNGKRIGLLEGSIQATQFYEWEKEHGLRLQHVYLTSFEDAKTKVENQAIDCLISTETPQWDENGMSAIATTGGSDIYFVINKNRPDLKNELDSAMRKMESDKPFYADELYQRYLSSVYNPTLASEEQTWLTEHGSIRIGWLNGDTGFSSFNAATGEMSGIITDYVTFASDCIRNQKLEFELVGFDSLEEEMKALKAGDIDLIFHFSQNPYVSEQNGFALSNAVLAINMAAVTAKPYFNETEEYRVAVEKDDLLMKWYLSYNYPEWTIVEYDSFEAVENAVRRGKADCFIAQPEQLTKYVEDHTLHSVFLTLPNNIAFAVRRGDATLLSILNKTLKTILTSMLTGALSMYDTSAQKVTLVDVVKANLLPVTIIVLTLFLAILLLILGFLRRSQAAEAKAKEAAARAQELNRKLQESQGELQAALKAAETASRAKTDFLSNMSHDIRTPMNAIIGLTTLMENEPDVSEKMRDYLSKLENSGRHLLELINNVLDMSRIESGQTTLNVTSISLTEQVAQTEELIRPQANERHQTFTVVTTHLVHNYVKADPTRLNQILMNLLSNAVKYTQEGGRIRLELEELPRNERYAKYKFIVEDNGIGMTEEYLQHIFEPFTRMESSVTNRVQGTGLGMAITKSVVDLIGGTIHVESTLGKGSRFEVTMELPIDTEAEASHAQSAPELPEKPEERSPLEGMHFLCAEDNEINAEILQMLLESKGASCTIFRNGQEIVKAFEQVQPGDYDMILMDVQMPVMDGLEATRRIRSGANPLGRTIPILAMTANAFLEDIQKSREAGMDEHLSKPVDIAVLEKTVRRFRVTPPAKK